MLMVSDAPGYTKYVGDSHLTKAKAKGIDSHL